MAFKNSAVTIVAGLACIVVSAATATVVVRILPHPTPAPVRNDAASKNDEVVMLLRELVEAERKKQAKEAQQEEASRRFRRPMAKDSTDERWQHWPSNGPLAKPAEP